MLSGLAGRSRLESGYNSSGGSFLLLLQAFVLLAIAASVHASGICQPPPDPTVAYPMYNRLLTVRLPLKRDPATRQWAAATAAEGPEALKNAGLHELRHLLVTVFPGKLWLHDASSAWLEVNNTQLGLRDLIVELSSPADVDHCSHVFQQHLFMAAETLTTDTHFNLQKFSDIRVDYHHIFGSCQPGQIETVNFYGALRLDRAEPACRNLRSAQDPAAVAARLPIDLRDLIDRLFFLPSNRFNVTSAAANDASQQLLMVQSNDRLLAFVIAYRLRVSQSPDDWLHLNAELASRYTQLTRHNDDYGVQRQGAAPSCLNYLNFASPPVALLAASCGTCYDIRVPVSVNISLSESADIRPPQCETVSAVSADAKRRVIESSTILDSLARNSVTTHLFVPAKNKYISIRSVSCSAQPRRLVVELLLRLRARHPALLRRPIVLQAGLQRNLNAYLMQRHLGLSSVRISGSIASTSVECSAIVGATGGGHGSSSSASAINNSSSSEEQTVIAKLAADVVLCRNNSNDNRRQAFYILRHRFQLGLGQQSLLAQLPSIQPELAAGLLRFIVTAALSRAAPAWFTPNGTIALLTVRQVATVGATAVVHADAIYAAGGINTAAAAVDLNRRFVAAIAQQLQPDMGGQVQAITSNITLEQRNCSGGGGSVSGTSGTSQVKDVNAAVDSSHALRLIFSVSADLLYGGRIGDYLVATALNAALRRSGLRDIDEVDLAGKTCANSFCRITAMILCRQHSDQGAKSPTNSGGNHSNAEGSMHSVSLSALTTSLTADPVLRPTNLQAQIVPAPSSTPLSSVLYRYTASPYFVRPRQPSSTSAARLTLVWRLASPANASAPLAYRRLPLPPSSSNLQANGGDSEVRLRFLLEQLLTDLLGSRIAAWPAALAYKSDGSLGRLEAAVALNSSATASWPTFVYDVTEGPQLSAFVRLADLRVRPVGAAAAAAASAAFDTALLQQTFHLHYFVSNASLQAMPASDLHRLLSGKLHFVLSTIFSGQPGRPSLLGFEFHAIKQPANGGGGIRVTSLTRIIWRFGEATFDEVALSRLVNTQLEALQANVNVFPMVFDSRQTALRLLDSRTGLTMPFVCHLLLRFRPTPSETAMAGASWLPVAHRLTNEISSLVNGSRVSVLSLSTDATEPMDALAAIPLSSQRNCKTVAKQLLALVAKKAGTTTRLIFARTIDEGVFASPDTDAAAAKSNLSVLLRHSAMLPYPQLQTTKAESSAGDYFCFLVSWAHALFNYNATKEADRRGICVSNVADRHQIRVDPLSPATAPALRVSTVSAFTAMPLASVMRRFWALKNFYLASNETFLDLDRVRVQLRNATGGSGKDIYSGVIINRLPPPPRHTDTTGSPNTTTTTSLANKLLSTTAAAAPSKTSPASGSVTPKPGQAAATSTKAAAATPAPIQPKPTPPTGPYYKPVDSMARLDINLEMPVDPWQSRYFLHNQSASPTTITGSISRYLIISALKQSLQRSAWQVASDEISFTRVSIDVAQKTISVGIDLLLMPDRNVAELESVLRTGLDQSMLLSTVFPKRTFVINIVKLPERRYIHRPPTNPPSTAVSRFVVEYRMLVRLSDSAPDYLRLRGSSSTEAPRDDLLLEFLIAQLLTDVYGDQRLSKRPQLLLYKSDSQLAMLHLRCFINQNSTFGAANDSARLGAEFASAWQRLGQQAAGFKTILHLNTHAGPQPPHRGLLLYQLLRLESYVSKKSLISMPSDYLSLLLRPKIEYVMRRVFPGGSVTLPQLLDVDASYVKKDGGLEIRALTRVSISPGFPLANLDNRLQLHTMKRLEELANDVNLVPSVFSVGRTDVRVLDLKEGLSLPYWCDLVYSFAISAAGLPATGFELANYLRGQLAQRLPQHAHLEQLAVLSFDRSAGSANQQVEVRALVTLSSARSLSFDDAAEMLMLAAKSQMRTRAVTSPFRSRHFATGMAPGYARSQQLTQAVTFIGTGNSDDLSQQMAQEKLVNYACHLYQSSLETAHWHSLHVLPHTCSATVAGDTSVTAVRVPVSHQPHLSLPGLLVNLTATVVSQTESTDLGPSAGQAFASALIVKNFYFNSGETVIANGVRLKDIGGPLVIVPPMATTASPSDRTIPPSATNRPPVPSHYSIQLNFPLSNVTFDYLSEPNTPMTLFMTESILRDALVGNGSVEIAHDLAVTNASLAAKPANASWPSTVPVKGYGRIIATLPPTFGASADRLQSVVADAIAAWPLAKRLFTEKPVVIAMQNFIDSTVPSSKSRSRRSLDSTGGSGKAGSSNFATNSPTNVVVEHRMQLTAPSLPVYFRYRDIPLRPDPLLTYLVERLVFYSLSVWPAVSKSHAVSGPPGKWPSLVWLRSDNATVTLCIRYLAPSSLSERELLDGFANAWMEVNRNRTGCALCLARHQQLRRLTPTEIANQTSPYLTGLLIYQRLQFDGFVGRDTLRKLSHDDLNQLMRHRLHYMLNRLYPARSNSNKISSINSTGATLAGFDFECYGRNESIVVFLLVRLVAPYIVSESHLKTSVAIKLLELAKDDHVRPAQLSDHGSDLRLLVRRDGLPKGVMDWLDIQATFEFSDGDKSSAAGRSSSSLHGYSIAAGAKQYLNSILAFRQSFSVFQLRLLRWKRLYTSGARHHQLVSVLATLVSTKAASDEATPRVIRAQLANATGLAGANLTLPLQDFDHQPMHYDRHHLELLHTGVSVEQSLQLVNSDIGGSVEAAELTSDFLCLLLASAFRQRGSARLRLVDDSCASRVTSRSGLLSPHPLSKRRISALSAVAYFTLHNSSVPFDASEATDTVDQLAATLNAYSDVSGRTLAVGQVQKIKTTPLYQALKFASASFPADLRNASSPLYRNTRDAIVRTLSVYLRRVSHLFAGQVASVRFDGDTEITVLVNYQVYPRLQDVSVAAQTIERHTEDLFTNESPFHGLQLNRDDSFVSTQPISSGRQPKLDVQSTDNSVPVAVFCILGIACFLLLVLTILLLARLIRMRRNNTGNISRLRNRESSRRHRASDAEKGQKNFRHKRLQVFATTATEAGATETTTTAATTEAAGEATAATATANRNWR